TTRLLWMRRGRVRGNGTETAAAGPSAARGSAGGTIISLKPSSSAVPANSLDPCRGCDSLLFVFVLLSVCDAARTRHRTAHIRMAAMPQAQTLASVRTSADFLTSDATIALASARWCRRCHAAYVHKA